LNQKDEKALNSLTASVSTTPKPSILSHNVITKQQEANLQSFQISRDSTNNIGMNTSKALSIETRDRNKAEVKELDKELHLYETYKEFENEEDKEN